MLSNTLKTILVGQALFSCFKTKEFLLQSLSSSQQANKSQNNTIQPPKNIFNGSSVKEQISEKLKQKQILLNQLQCLVMLTKIKQNSHLHKGQVQKVKMKHNKTKIQQKYTPKINILIDWLPHALFLGLLIKALKNYKRTSRHPTILIGFYFWSITYPWAYKTYQGLAQYYFVPTIIEQLQKASLTLKFFLKFDENQYLRKFQSF